MSESNYDKFFGSPELVALTFATIDEWIEQEVRMSQPPEDGKEWFAPSPYYLLSETIGVNLGCNAMALLGWLRRDAE